MSAIINRLDGILHEQRGCIEEWFVAQRFEARPLLYNSVDLRHSGVKLAPVDTNVFPAGFNHLSLAARGRAVQQFHDHLNEAAPGATKLLLVPENHTRNLGYLENLSVLAELLTATGRVVRIGSLVAEGEPLCLQSLSDKTVEEWPLRLQGNLLATIDGFVADAIILNNDCSTGAPSLLEAASQPVLPSFQMGWYNRRKSEHERAYLAVAREFAALVQLDPWLISTVSHRCGVVHFHERKGIDKVAEAVEKVLAQLREKYREHGIQETPYAFIKADSGTYGMGIMTARSGEEVVELNKKTRNKMNVIKEGTENTEVIVQEGVTTVDAFDGAPAEPMIYLVDGVPVGGAYRLNEARDSSSNLNAAGMRFVGMCDEGECDEGARERIRVPDCNFGVFGIVAALSALAAAREVYGGWNIGFSI